MPATKSQHSAATPKAKTPAKRKATATRKATTRRNQAAAVDRTTELSEDVIKSLESGQRAAIDAVRKFVDVVDERLPAVGARPSRRKDIVDAALEMADRLVRTQYDFISDVVESAGHALTGSDAKK